jgi:hypothetical protein
MGALFVAGLLKKLDMLLTLNGRGCQRNGTRTVKKKYSVNDFLFFAVLATIFLSQPTFSSTIIKTSIIREEGGAGGMSEPPTNISETKDLRLVATDLPFPGQC